MQQADETALTHAQHCQQFLTTKYTVLKKMENLNFTITKQVFM
jgi:hypothetical protein